MRANTNWSWRISRKREAVARLLGAQLDEISFTGPTSSGLNAIANGLDWADGDEVVCYLDDYPANFYPWLALERRGVKAVLLETGRIGEITPEIVEQALTLKRTTRGAGECEFLQRLSNRSGIDRRALRGARRLVFSRCHSDLGAFPIALDAIDFLSAGAQKWMLGPSGAGILYVKKSRRDLLRRRRSAAGMCNRPISLRNAKSICRRRPKFEPALTTTAHRRIGAARLLLEQCGAAQVPSDDTSCRHRRLEQHTADGWF